MGELIAVVPAEGDPGGLLVIGAWGSTPPAMHLCFGHPMWKMEWRSGRGIDCETCHEPRAVSALVLAWRGRVIRHARPWIEDAMARAGLGPISPEELSFFQESLHSSSVESAELVASYLARGGLVRWIVRDLEERSEPPARVASR